MGGFMVPREWVEMLEWVTSGGQIIDEDLPESTWRRLLRGYAYVAMWQRKWAYRLVLRWYPFCWLPQRWQSVINLPYKYRWQWKPSKTTWLTSDGIVHKTIERD